MSRRAGVLVVLALAAAAAAWLTLGGGLGPGSPDGPSVPHPDEAPSGDSPSEPPRASPDAPRGDEPVPAPSPTSPLEEGAPTDPAAFEGIVVDARTKAPVDGAIVSAAKEDPACRHRRLDLATAETDPGGDALPPIDAPPPDSVQTTTGPDGAFRLDWKAGTPADVVARKAGYGFGCAPGVSPGRRLVLRAVAGGSIRGLVRRPDGRPVAGALASLHAKAVEGKVGPPLDSTTTDHLGAFELRGVAAGRYALRLRHGSSMPGALDDVEPSARPVSIVLAPALRVWLEVTSDEGIPAGTTATWRLAGLPWREGRVPLEGRASGPRPAARDATWARVLVPCERSEASLGVNAPGFLAWASPTLSLPPDGGETEASVRLERDPNVAALRLVLEDEAGKPVGFEERSVRAIVRSIQSGAVIEPVPGAALDPWVRKGLVPSAYRVELSSPLHAPASLEVELRAGDDVERRIRLAPPAKLRVRIEAKGDRRVRFRLRRDGKPVVAYAEGPATPAPADAESPTFFADARGVVLSGLGAGEVTVEVVSPDLTADPVPVTLVEGGEREVTITASAVPR